MTPAGNAPSSCVRSWRVAGGLPAEGAPPDAAPTGGANAELGIICVPATPLRGFAVADASPPATPGGPGSEDGDDPPEGAGGVDGDAAALALALAFASAFATAAAAALPTFGFAFDVAASESSSSERNPMTAFDAGVPAAAASNAPRDESTLLTASGETCG